MAGLKQKYESRGVYFISLTIEPNDDQAAVDGFLRKADATTLNAGRASGDVQAKLIRMGGNEPGVIPSVVFVDKAGKVTKSLVAPFSHDDLEQAVAALAG